MSEIYDATYNAIRSKISFGNIDEAVSQAIRDQGISHAIDLIKSSISVKARLIIDLPEKKVEISESQFETKVKNCLGDLVGDGCMSALKEEFFGEGSEG